MIRCVVAGLVLISAACPSSNTTRVDAAAPADATSSDAGSDSDAAPPYRHSIVIDGTNDFTADESFATSSSGYTAFVAWSDTALYVGYEGEDIASAAADSDQKWLLVYLDVDPGAGTGAAVGDQYNTQAPGFPAGFGAEYYYRWKSDDSFEDLQAHAGGTSWTVESTVLDAAVNGTFVEVAIPRAMLGSPERLGITALMLNEKPFSEWAYAGLYATSFTDGYYDNQDGPIPISSYLEADFASARAPNDPSNRQP